MTQFEPIIGLEVHAQLSTRTKLFCSCSTQFGAEPNFNTCPVCLAQPGALPVLNKKAVEYAILAGLALGCKIAPTSVFARKNYFYPDLPKGYQISQYELPICLGGGVDIEVEGQKKRITLTRIHMEEDAGKSLHEMGSDEYSHVDLNRACTPLIEIVSEPEIRNAKEASTYLKRLRDILVYLGVCDGNMEEGSLRCDANVSIRPVGETKFGTRVELKNINSFRFVEKAIEYEIARQEAVLLDGGQVVQETRLYDNAKNTTESMRSKEEAHDYRYFPDPDLLPLEVSEELVESIRKQMPELGHQKAERFVQEFQIPEYDSQVLTAEKRVADYFEQVAQLSKDPKRASNLIMTELLALEAKGEKPFENIAAPELAKAIAMTNEGKISSKMLKEVIATMHQKKQGAEEVVSQMGSQLSDTGAIEALIDQVLTANPQNVAEYKSGKEKLFGFFVGQVMKESKGKANPQLLNDLLKKKLGN
ncbi:MAG: Asp-tRNA(Asn)/Glu-tRNA(Gln) amidotransferase subunit GatB [Deltaproteobacteria bacterium]|nr:Asp-tRNA(Asn)/Glu-tRNA(Gln) amidotransferase subunit GatB [Deltaproteobacteria bacterium]